MFNVPCPFRAVGTVCPCPALQPHPQSYSAAGQSHAAKSCCTKPSVQFVRSHDTTQGTIGLLFPGPLNTAQPEFLCCKTKLLMLFYINVVVYTCGALSGMYASVWDLWFYPYMLDLWHSPLRDFKDKYGAIGPHIGVVTVRDWSCGLIYHIIYTYV